jgi:hypothetical protein
MMLLRIRGREVLPARQGAFEKQLRHITDVTSVYTHCNLQMSQAKLREWENFSTAFWTRCKR